MCTKETPTVTLKHVHGVRGGGAARDELSMTPSHHATRLPVTTIATAGQLSTHTGNEVPSYQAPAFVGLGLSRGAGGAR